MQVRSEQALRLSVERLESLHRELGKAEMRVMRKIKISQILEFPYIFRSGSKTGTRFKAQCYETRNSAKGVGEGTQCTSKRKVESLQILDTPNILW